MVKIDKNRYGLKYVEVWFPNDDWKEMKCDLLRLHCLPTTQGLKKEKVEIQHTRLTDLTKTEEELQEDISKTFRYDIRRSHRDKIDICYYSSADICADPRIIDKFAECYHVMYEEKKIDIWLDTAAVISCAQNGGLVLSVVFCDGNPIVFHSYIYDGEITILWHSCSNYRSEKELASVIARANKRLHWEDWLFFKRRGCKTYDWGGVFAFESDNGIDKFKECFGGVPHDYYHTVPMSNSVIGMLGLKVFSLLPHKKKL